MGKSNGEPCVQWVVKVLNGEQPTSKMGDLAPYSEYLPNYTITRIACPVNVLVEKNGEYLSNIPGMENYESSFGNLHLVGNNKDIKILDLDSDTYDMQLFGTHTGTMDYSVRFMDSTNTIQETRYFHQIPVTKNTSIITEVNNDAETVIHDNTTYKYQEKEYLPEITKHYRFSSKTINDVWEEKEVSSMETILKLYNQSPILNNVKTIDISSFSILLLDHAISFAELANRDDMSLFAKYQSNIRDTSVDVIFNILDTQRDIMTAVPIYITQEEMQYLDFPLTLGQNILVVEPDFHKNFYGSGQISLPLSIIEKQIGTEDFEIQAYTRDNGGMKTVDKESYAIKNGSIIFDCIDDILIFLIKGGSI